MVKKKYSKQISLGYDANGKRIRKRVYGDSPTALKVAERKAVIDASKITTHSDITFKEYSKEWLETYKAIREKATYNMYVTALNKTELIDYRPIRAIRSAEIQALINQHKDHPNACGKLCLTLKQIFKKAITDGIIVSNPVMGVELPKGEASVQRGLTEDEKTAIKKAALSPQDRMYVLLLYYFGLRPQEALALTPADFDFKKSTLTIKRAVGYDYEIPYIKSSKTYKQRTIPVAKVFIPEVKSYIRTEKIASTAFLIASDGKLMAKTVKSDMWLRIKKEINRQLNIMAKENDPKHLEDDLTNGLRPYSFRHNFCCECYYRGITIKKCADLMGNSPEMVMRVYTHLDNSKEPLDKLSELTL